MKKMKQVLARFLGAFTTAIITVGICTTLYAPVQAQSRLPELGTTGGGTMSIQREQMIGDLYMRQLRGAAPVVHDPVLSEYLNDIGNRLVVNAPDVRFPFEFVWINHREINAFAFLGGKIGVHTGLIYEAATESELASVLAHEVAHVTQRHIVRNIEQQQSVSAGRIAAMIAGALLTMASPDLGMATISAVSAGGLQSQINYTRLFEQEADRVGINILANAGFDPQGAPNFFGRLSSKYRYSSRPPEMLLTHPLSESRVADTRQRADMLPSPVEVDNFDFKLAKARISARHLQLTSSSEFEQDMNSRNSSTAASARYGAAIIALDSGNPAKAEELLTPLRRDYPNNLFVIDVHTDILLALNRVDEAYAMLENAYMKRPNEQVITVNFANTAMKRGDYQMAIQLLRDYLLRRPDNIIALELLTEAYQEAGQLAAMHETRGEIYALYGGFKIAIDQFHTAHTNSDNQLTKKRLQARIDQIKALQHQAETL